MEYQIELSPEMRGHGGTRHFRNGAEVSSQVASLRIETIEGDPGVYIFYFDSAGNELNDLYFDTLDLAVRQVKAEFGIAVKV